MEPKQLKKLADMCRKAGIKHYKCADFEFTLTDDMPEPKVKAKGRHAAAPEFSGGNEKFETDSLSSEDLLFWSTGVAAEVSIGEDN